jgi:hypothetical protein
VDLQIVLLVVLAVGAGWKSWVLAHASRDRLSRLLLIACFSLLALGQALSLPPVTHWVDVVTRPGVGKVSYNGSTMAGLLALLCFFHYAVQGAAAQHRIRKLRAERLVFVLSLGVMATLMVMTPPGLRSHTLQSPYITLPQIAWFYITGNMYFAYAYLSAGLSVWRYSAAADRQLSRVMRISLRVTAAGLTGLMTTSVDRALWVIARFNGSPPLEWLDALNWQIANVAFILMVIGLCLLAVVHAVEAARLWVIHRRQYRQLAPLWGALHQAYPELALDRARADRFLRRVIECRDGLTRLNPYIALVAQDSGVSHCSSAELASYVRSALVLKPQLDDAGHETGWSATEVVTLKLDDIDSDVRDLVALSNALNGRHP